MAIDSWAFITHNTPIVGGVQNERSLSVAKHFYPNLPRGPLNRAPSAPRSPPPASPSEDVEELQELDSLLRSAIKSSKKLRKAVEARKANLVLKETSEDYAARLAEKAIFRRLLSNDSLDGVRFRWLFTHRNSLDFRVYNNIDSLRAFIDQAISFEESKRGPSA